MKSLLGSLTCVFVVLMSLVSQAVAELKTWDGKHSIEKVAVSVVYFVPKDRTPLPDWHDRASYFCRRIEHFHRREYGEQSVLKTTLHAEPFRSARSTEQLRNGDGDFTFFQTLREVNDALSFGQDKSQGFPILLVLSDINWRPLDDFYRVKPADNGSWAFEGNSSGDRHFPGAASGGARATYLADRGVGWGLVSADGWRVPYSGSDCVVYHEGVGHTVGLPHPQPGNRSVMSLGQYHGWINESWLDDDQKKRLGWKPLEKPFDREHDLFSSFTAWPDPFVPRPNTPVGLKLTWPAKGNFRSCRVRIQTDLLGPWTEVVATTVRSESPIECPNRVSLGSFDRATPVSYRVDAVLADGRDVELWGYFQVREKPDQICVPPTRSRSEEPQAAAPRGREPDKLPPAIDLLALVDLSKDTVSGEWTRSESRLESPKDYGARIELPYRPPEEYELVVIAEPLDPPNGLILGQKAGDQRFLALLNFTPEKSPPLSALENIDGKNVGANETTVAREVLAKGRLSQIICTVKKDSVRVTCDGRTVIDWQGDAKRLSLSDYWKTPSESALFLGAYDCRYRFHRVTISPLRGEGRPLRASN